MAAAVRLLRRVGGNLARVGRLGVARAMLPSAPCWLSLRLGPPLDELRPPALPFQREASLGLFDVLQTLAAAAGDPRIAGVLLRLGGAPRGLARVAGLRRAVAAVRAAGKPVAAYGERLGLADYWIASAADRIWLPETGTLQVVGLRAEGLYLGEALRQLAIEPELLQVGTHKTAGEMFTRSEMSREQREQLEGLLDDLYHELVEAIATGRGLDPQGVRERIDRGPYGARDAREQGLVDACLYPDQLDESLATLAPATGRRPRRSDATGVAQAEAPLYHRLRATDAGWHPLRRDRPRVAYVVLRGRIHDGSAHLPAGVSVPATRELLERLRLDPAVHALVVRIASPGGDAVASDLLWRALHVVARDKPLVVSLGDVAASGGYYAAVAGHALVAEAATLTGSIGVVGGKFSVAGLYERLGVGIDFVERGRRAGLLSASRPFTSEERASLRHELRAVYDVFVERVAEGRGLSRPAVEEVAQGRVWSGRRAHALHLVDELGGPLEALRDARRRAGIPDAERVIVDVYPRRAPLPGLRSLVGMGLAWIAGGESRWRAG